MKKLFLILALLIFTNLHLANATPYFPNGMPKLGPLQGEITFWGDEDGKYFDGVGYSYGAQINMPKQKNTMTISVMVNEYYYHGNKPDEKTSSFGMQLENELKGFTGKIKLHIINPDGKINVKNFQLSKQANNVYSLNEAMNLNKAHNDAELILELFLDTGKTISLPLEKQTANDLIMISQILYTEK